MNRQEDLKKYIQDSDYAEVTKEFYKEHTNLYAEAYLTLESNRENIRKGIESE